MTLTLRRPRVCEHRLTRASRLARAWDAVRRHHTRHVCTRQRSFERGSQDVARMRPMSSRYFFPMAMISFCVRSRSRPSEIAGVASTGVDISFIATTSYLAPASSTKTWPSSLAT